MIESAEGCLGKLTNAPSYKWTLGLSAQKEELFYDLASLTKVVVTNSLLIELMQDLSLSLSDFREKKIEDFISTLPANLRSLKIASVWDHKASLQAHFLLDPLKSRMPFSGSRTQLWAYVLSEISKHTSPSDECVYSDLDYWVLGALLESHYKKDLKELWQDYKKKYSLPSNDLVFGPIKESGVPTENRHPTGIVNDDNACFMQGIAPHAGLFSTAEALWSWMRHMQELYDSRKELQEYFIPQGTNRFWCGWDRPTGDKSQAGDFASEDNVLGHLGFTGTALWWNPTQSLGGLLLTNRVFPAHTEASRVEIQKLRNKFFSVLWQNNRDELWKAFLQDTSSK